MQSCSAEVLVPVPPLLPFSWVPTAGYESTDSLPLSALLQVRLPCHPLGEQREFRGTSGGIEGVPEVMCREGPGKLHQDGSSCK